MTLSLHQGLQNRHERKQREACLSAGGIRDRTVFTHLRSSNLVVAKPQAWGFPSSVKITCFKSMWCNKNLTQLVGNWIHWDLAWQRVWEQCIPEKRSPAKWARAMQSTHWQDWTYFSINMNFFHLCILFLEWIFARLIITQNSFKNISCALQEKTLIIVNIPMPAIRLSSP